MSTKAKPTYGISRVDNDGNRTHCWMVTIQRQNEIYRANFSDGVYGSRNKAFNAAVEWRDDVLAQTSPMSRRDYSNILKSNNRSGIVGVCRCAATETKHLPAERQRWFWCAHWTPTSGPRRRIKFSVSVYGEEGAKKLAIQARENGVRNLGGVFNPGAARRQAKRRGAR